MIPDLRNRFNQNFTAAKVKRSLSNVTTRCGTEIHFRNCETPCFFSKGMIEKMARYGKELLHQLLSNPDYLKISDASIPPEYRVPNESPHPLFVQADFGLDVNLEPKLVEIQGFPSLYAYQPIVAESYRQAYDIHPSLRHVLAGGEYWAGLRKASVGDCVPENVILMDIDPQHQKTMPDFLLTEKY